MTFVYEKVPDADKEKFNALNFKNALHRPILADGYVRWCIDRERDAILVGLGGGGGEGSDIPAFYSLVWRGQWIGFELFTRGQGYGATGLEFWHNLTAVNIPETQRNQKNEIFELIREGLYAEGSQNGRWKVITFDLKFPEPTFY